MPVQQKGSEVRGNPETQPGLGGKMQDAGRLATFIDRQNRDDA